MPIASDAAAIMAVVDAPRSSAGNASRMADHSKIMCSTPSTG